MHLPRKASLFIFLLLAAAALQQLDAQVRGGPQPVIYRISFPAPEHHYAEVEVTFAQVKGVLQARMSRSSPGRYALHNFAAQVFDVKAQDGSGKSLKIERPAAHRWDVAGHDGTVRITYKLFGQQLDGVYSQIDSTHAHLSAPATFMWAAGFEDRPTRVTINTPAGKQWKIATQLFPTDDPLTFTAPNFQYFMDSPIEASNFELRSFQVNNPDGKTFTIRSAVHHADPPAAIDTYASATEKIVKEAREIFGEYPEFEGGTYTFLMDYVPWGGGAGMEHRNSTVIAGSTLAQPNDLRSALITVAHEFVHAWNIERIRPKSLEPFNFDDVNTSGELWIGEGFSQYYQQVILARTGLDASDRMLIALATNGIARLNSAGLFRSIVGVSELAAITDGAESTAPNNFSYAGGGEYYRAGAGIALAMDLELRIRSNSKVSLDDYMRALWKTHGKPGGRRIGYVDQPYTLSDAESRLAEVSGDRAFAADFFKRYVHGREVADYAALLDSAGVLIRKINPGAAWIDVSMNREEPNKVRALVRFGSPAFRAGIDMGDVILSLGGEKFTTMQTAMARHKPGDTVEIEYRRPTGEVVKSNLTLSENPGLRAVTVESNGGVLTPEQKAFRQSWLGSKVK